MKRGLSDVFRVVEWLLIVAGVVVIALMIIPFSEMFNFDRDIRSAKSQGIYYDGPTQKQSYFESKLSLEGAIYTGSDLIIYMRGCRFGTHASLPQQVYLSVPDGKTIGPQGWGGSSTIFCTRGMYIFEEVPVDMREVTIGNEAYGESFSFTLILEREGEK